MRRLAATVLAVAILSPVPFAAATHEVDHRLTIRGAIYESDGTPRGRSMVSVVDPSGEVLASVDTGRNGKFQFALHLHDADAGRALILRSGNINQEFRLVFDPNNTRKERIVTVVIGELARELRRRNAILTGAGIAAIAALAAAAALLLTRKTRRHKKRGGRRSDTGARKAGSGARRGPPQKAAAGGRSAAAGGRRSATGQRRSGSKRR